MFHLGTWSVQGKSKVVAQCTIHREDFQTKRPLLASLREDKFLAGLFSAFEKRERERERVPLDWCYKRPRGQVRSVHSEAAHASHCAATLGKNPLFTHQGCQKSRFSHTGRKTPELEHTVCNGTRALVIGREGL